MKHLSDIINPDDIKKHALNIITTGCGTGKTYWATHVLPHYWPDVKPGEILMATSRSLAAKQTAKGVGTDYEYGDSLDLKASNIHVVTFEGLGRLLYRMSLNLDDPIHHIKVLVIDEIHALMSDTYMYSCTCVRMWLNMLVNYTDARVIGLTATPGILTHYGICVHQVNTEPLMRYRAKHLITTDWYTLPELIRTRLPGKAIIMCLSDKQCYKLAEQLPNSFVLVSHANKANNEKMDWMRQYIIDNQTLPEADDEGKPIDYLIATSTAREGYTLKTGSGVRNVISCVCDSMHTVQFMGRVRDDIDNLVVVDAPSPVEQSYTLEYIRESRRLFREYMAGKSQTWLRQIEYALYEPTENAEHYTGSGADGRFRAYIDANWLLTDETLEDNPARWVDAKEKRQEIAEQALKCGLFAGLTPRLVTYARVEKWLGDNGYTVKSDRRSLEGKQRRCKFITCPEHSLDGDATSQATEEQYEQE